MVPKKKKKHNVQLVVGCACLMVGIALVGANLAVVSLNRVDLMEGIILILVGGYLVGSMVWSS